MTIAKNHLWNIVNSATLKNKRLREHSCREETAVELRGYSIHACLTCKFFNPDSPLCLSHTFLDCGKTQEFKAKEPIACRDCGYRILYKKRTKRSKLLAVNAPLEN